MIQDEIEENEQETFQSRKHPNFLVPDENEIKKVVLLPSELTKEYESKIEPNFNRFEFEESLLPEFNPLAFTVGGNFFDLAESRIKEVGFYRFNDHPNIYIEKRGLLQFVNKHKFLTVGESFFDSGFDFYEETVEKHIELQFPVRSGFKITNREGKEYGESYKLAKTKIHFDDIESGLITSGIFKKEIIIKVKPEREIHRLFIDKVRREIILTIERKDFSLAEQVMATILTQVNEIKLRKLL